MNTIHTQPMLALLLAVCSAPVWALAGEPTAQIQQTTDRILAIVQDPALKGADKDAERQKKVRVVVDERFDWADMARSAYGLPWKKLSDAQHTEFTAVFGDLVNHNYMSKVEGYSGEKIQYKGDKVDGLYAVVDVVIVTLRNTDIPVSYRVINKDSKWLVYDVVIEGVSMVNNYRSQISGILNSSSYDALITRLKAKTDATVPDKVEPKPVNNASSKPVELAR